MIKRQKKNTIRPNTHKNQFQLIIQQDILLFIITTGVGSDLVLMLSHGFF